MEPPYASRLNRPLVGVSEDGTTHTKVDLRDPEKTAFDKRVFETDFF